jgi:endoglucanase
MEELLSRLIKAHGVSGNEGEVRGVIIEAIQPLVDDVRVDSSGNVIAHKEGRDPNFMLAAHMDEIGLMVREIAPSGLLLCAAIGGVNAMSMLGTRVTIQGIDEVIHGIVTTRLISCGEEHEETPDVEDLVVDTGLGPEKLAELGVTVGAFLEPAKETNWLTYGNTISGKALDDRIGCYCLIEIARKLRRVKQEVFYVFTVQEEIGMHGAKTSAFSIRPRWALVIDVTAASDLSEEAERSTGTKLMLGKGPCLLHMDENFISNVELIRALQSLAKRLKIEIQHEVSAWGSTDASNISTVRRGVPSATISVPIRNVHSTIEIANRKDVNATIELVSEFLKKPPASLKRATTKISKDKVVKDAAPKKGVVRKEPTEIHAASEKKHAAKKKTAKRSRP